MNDELKTGLEVRSLLDDSANQLPPHVQARLNAAIAASVNAHRQSSRPVQSTGGGLLLASGIKEWLGTFTRPAVSLAFSAFFVAIAGFGIFQEHQSTKQAEIVAMSELDAAILADDLPPDAWLDPGFVGYSSALEKRSNESDPNLEQWLEQIGQEQPST